MPAFFASSADFTQAFRDLSETPVDEWLSETESWGLKKLQSVKKFRLFVEAFKARGLNDQDRMLKMQRVNPRYILRNWMAQRAIESAENGDFSEVQLLHKILKSPYEKQDEAEEAGYARPVPSWSKDLVVSCSS